MSVTPVSNLWRPQFADTASVGQLLLQPAEQMPTATAIAVAPRGGLGARENYKCISFRELEDDASSVAHRLVFMGVQPGDRLVLLVHMGIDFISLVFALMKAGAVVVLLDPGMGRKRLLRCLGEIEPDGFVAIPKVHAIRLLLKRRFARARHNVTVGRKLFWGGVTLDDLRRRGIAGGNFLPALTREDSAAIIFTSGGTGVPKGVHYQHGNFLAQVEQIRDHYDIAPGGIDVAGFPLFALFNAAMGVTTVVPEMDFARPATVDPRKFVASVQAWQATQSFASPAVWNVVGRYCERTGTKLSSLKRVYSAGAPVPPRVLSTMKQSLAEDTEMYTPYGATEALPVASVDAGTVLGETALRSSKGSGTCVGGPFRGITWQVIRITDEPIQFLGDVEACAPHEIGELIVAGPQVTREYLTRKEANQLSKITEPCNDGSVPGDRVWHRMGDVGYLDDQNRFWFCGRKVHRVQTQQGTLFSVPCEAVLNEHPAVFRSALVGIGEPPVQVPVVVVEIEPGVTGERQQWERELAALARQFDHTQAINHFLFHPKLPVDVRHNAKINREELADWAAKKLTSI